MIAAQARRELHSHKDDLLVRRAANLFSVAANLRLVHLLAEMGELGGGFADALTLVLGHILWFPWVWITR